MIIVILLPKSQASQVLIKKHCLKGWKKLRQNRTSNLPDYLAALGLGSEGGEFVEIVKKIFLQGKPFTEDNVFHMKRELGDIIWYWATACMALDLDPYEVINENKSKLEARYGKGFKVEKSEHRKDGDL